MAAEAIVYEGPSELHLGQYKSAVRVLAELHAHWWNYREIGSGAFAPHWTNQLLSAAVDWAKAGLSDFIESGNLSGHEVETVEHALSIAQPLLVERAANQKNLCVNHGDSALWNFVMDKHDSSIVKLVDFQTWCVNPPAWDIGYMMYLLWPTEFRARFGGEILRAYFDQLEDQGVAYDERDFFEDLRICIVGLITMNLANYNLGIWQEDQVRERLTWILAAYHELDCDKIRSNGT